MKKKRNNTTINFNLVEYCYIFCSSVFISYLFIFSLFFAASLCRSQYTVQPIQLWWNKSPCIDQFCWFFFIFSVMLFVSYSCPQHSCYLHIYLSFAQWFGCCGSVYGRCLLLLCCILSVFCKQKEIKTWLSQTLAASDATRESKTHFFFFFFIFNLSFGSFAFSAFSQFHFVCSQSVVIRNGQARYVDT